MSQDTEEKKQAGILPQIFTAVIIAVLVGGTAPWWWDKLIIGAPDVVGDYICQGKCQSPGHLASISFTDGQLWI